MRLTDEQRAVVGSDDPRFTVRAGAGSGKTKVLVDRYVRHVVELGHGPDHIVAVTFTRKAAAEMKKRIVTRLREEGLTEQAQAAETGPIQTLHGFCERILRENCVEALVSPDFEVLDSSDVRLRTEAAVRSALLQVMDEGSSPVRLIRRLSGQGGNQRPGWTHAQLRNMVDATMTQLRGAGIERPDLAAGYADVETARALWDRALRSALGLGERTGGPSDTSSKALIEEVKASGGKPPSWLKPLPVESESASAEDTCALVQLAVRAWEALESSMEDDQVFDFPLLERKAVHLVERSDVTRERLQSSIKALLVDEAQDLNPVQYRLIDSLGAPSEMLVGDPQQSIYGFRFAERRLFVERSEELRNYVLSRNHRSGPGILRFVDEVFAPTWGEGHMPMRAFVPEGDDPFDTGAKDCDGVELWPMAAKDNATVAALIHQMVEEGTPLRNVTVLTRRNSAISDIAERLESAGVRCRKVGGSERFLTRLEVRDLANALEALCDPYNDFSFLALLHGPMVGLSLESTVLAAVQSPSYESVRTLSDLPPEDQVRLEGFWPWFERLRETVDRVPAWETIAALFSETPFLDRCAALPHAEQALANVRKMLSMAVARPQTGAREFADQIHDITFLRHKEGEAPVTDENEEAVTLMTVHKAKGLEFDTVVVTETHERLSPKRKPLVIEAHRGLVALGLSGRHSTAYLWLSHLATEREREEQLRVLYVAMTRAERRLCLVTSEQGNNESSAGILAARGGLPSKPLPGIKVRRIGDR